MKTSYLTVVLALVCLGCGFLSGHVFRKQRNAEVSEQKLAVAQSQRVLKQRRARSPFDFLNDASDEIRSAPEFSEEVDRLYRDLKSPLRAGSLLDYHIYDSNFDELVELLNTKQVHGVDLLNEVGKRLAKDDPDRALSVLLHDRKYRLRNMDDFYAFRDGLLREVARSTPEKGLASLQALERGGVQMDNSLYFSGQWAKVNPAAAAEHFEELVTLRNMKMNGDLNLPRDSYAKTVMKVWVKKDREAAQSYVENLPAGATRETLSKALNLVLK